MVNKQWTTNIWNMQPWSTTVVPLCRRIHLYVATTLQMNNGNSRRHVPKQRHDLTKENSSYVVIVFHTVSHAYRSRTLMFQRVTNWRFALFTNIWFPAGTRDFSLLQSVRKHPWSHPDSYSESTDSSVPERKTTEAWSRSLISIK